MGIIVHVVEPRAIRIANNFVIAVTHLVQGCIILKRALPIFTVTLALLPHLACAFFLSTHGAFTVVAAMLPRCDFKSNHPDILPTRRPQADHNDNDAGAVVGIPNRNSKTAPAHSNSYPTPNLCRDLDEMQAQLNRATKGP